jgi:carboxypeptidase Q
MQIPDDYGDAVKYFRSLPPSVMNDLYDAYEERLGELSSFLKEEGVAGVIKSDPRSHNGIINAEQAGPYKANRPMAPATFIVTEEQYSRMQRLVEDQHPVTVRMDLKAKFSDADVDSANIIGEIPGVRTPDEVVMIGAHFDSWHSATGATDNGAGSAVMMEAMRILKTLNLPMNRTIRIGLWSG